MNDWLPMDEEQSKLQVDSILTLLGSTPLDVVDVGCGDGRLLIPLAVAGHNVVGIDIDPQGISACASQCAQLDVDAELIDGNIFDVFPLARKVDAIVCCGQTFMLFSEVEEAVEVLRMFRKSLHKGGMVILDDIPGDLWQEVSQGRWANGVNEDASLQLVWEANDAVFTIREGEQVRADLWELQENDQRLRLWTMGALRLAASLAELSVPEVRVAGAILVMQA